MIKGKTMGECLFGEEEYVLTTTRQAELQREVGAASLELQELQPQTPAVDPTQQELSLIYT